MTKRLPNVDGLSELSFITNYFFMGCEIPPWGMIEVSREPTEDLFLLILGLDAFDMIQTMIGPKGGRNRRPGRHGRKNFRFRGFPDPNDAVGGLFRGDADLEPLYQVTKTKYLFKALNVAERINFTAAVIDGVTDVGFQTLWGFITANKDHCPQMQYLYRHSGAPYTIVQALTSGLPIPFRELIENQGFNSSGWLAWTNIHNDFTSAASITLWADAGDMENVRMAFRSSDGAHHSTVHVGDISDGDTITISLETEQDAGTILTFVVMLDSGHGLITSADLMAFSGTWF